MVEKKDSRKMTVYGMLIPVLRKISSSRVVRLVLSRPSRVTIPNRGRMIITSGTPIAVAMLVWITLFPRNFMRDST